ncbi:MAG: integrase, partial [Proteobacteria bacterium]
MAIEKLTDIRIKKAKAKNKEYSISDGGGLYLVVRPNGNKLWRIRYTSPTLHKKRLGGLGKYPAITLLQARQKSREYHKLISQGVDPIDQKREQKYQNTERTRGLFDNVVDEWLNKTKSNITAKTRKNAKSMFVNDIKPYLKHNYIKDIKHRELVRAFEVKNETAPAMAEKLFRYCNDLWKWACTQDLCEYNIMGNIHKKSIIPPRATIHHKTITDLKELKRLVNALYGLGSNHSKANALKLLLHIPLRASNLTSLKWDYVNFKDRIITIPRQEMKMKDPNLQDFILPMSDEVVKILINQRESIFTR